MKDFASFNAIAFICNYFISRLSDIYKLVHNDLFSWLRSRLSEKLETFKDWFPQ